MNSARATAPIHGGELLNAGRSLQVSVWPRRSQAEHTGNSCSLTQSRVFHLDSVLFIRRYLSVIAYAQW